MEFLIADTFTDSLARLTGDEQKAVKLTAMDLQLNPASPGLSFHKLDKVRDKNFWSVRVNKDIRLIVHRNEISLLLCYVDHHDKAYDWAGRRKLETHPKTGAAQLVEIRETVKEIVVPAYVQAEPPLAAAAEKPLLFAGVADDQLLGYGVPVEWLGDVKKVNEDTLLVLADHLPAEAAEALLELATGGKPAARKALVAHASRMEFEADLFLAQESATRVEPSAADAQRLEENLAELLGSLDRSKPRPAREAQPLELPAPVSPFEHPDARRRFRLITNATELERALDYPWEKWTVFLHPAQLQIVERLYTGPARVSGSAGTGKTIVAIHRAAHLARQHPDARVLLTTFSDTLAHALRTMLRRLLGNEPRLAERIDVYSLDAIALRLYRSYVGTPTIADEKVTGDLIREAAAQVSGHSFGQRLLVTEWEQVIDAWQLKDWESYRDFVRIGRKTRLPEAQRKLLWAIFDRVRTALESRQLITMQQLFTSLAAAIAAGGKVVFDFAIIDEAQDLSPSQLRFLSALGSDRPNALFFAGDLGQRIFQPPFSWKSVGVDVRGRSRTLRVNYRTSHQIRTQADRLLGPAVADTDGNAENRNDTVSVFNGPAPAIRTFPDDDQEGRAVGDWIAELTKSGLAPHEFGVFVRSPAQLDRAEKAVRGAGLAFKILDDHVATYSGHASIGTMHLAKGLEFRAVAVMACDDEVIPLQERIETVGDDGDLQEVYDTERHLLYVACTRARDHLLVTSIEPSSEFLDDLRA